jgi:hypothetical protein
MDRTVPAVVAVALAVGLVLATAVAPVAAHVYNIEADDQRSADGTLLLEWEFVGTDGWVAVRGDDGGDPGEVLGHRRVTSETAFRTDTTVEIDENAWASVEDTREVWVVLHSEGEGEGFDPEEDPLRTGFSGEPAGTRVTVERAAAPTSVTAQGFGAETSTDGTVTVRRVELAEAGHVAVHRVDGDIAANVADEDIGEAVGSVQLSAGVHENVTVDLEESFREEASGETLLAAVVYAGDGAFGDDATTAVTAGGSLVSTVFGVELRGSNSTEPTPTPTPEEADVVNTPEPTVTPTTTTGSTDGNGAGPGAAAAALALVVGAALVALRRRG